jgi:fatty-acyl-CoA synthase
MPIPQLTQAYGITEIGILSQTDCNDVPEKTIYTMGKPLNGMEMKIIDPDSRKKLPNDVQGEICVRGPFITKGYYSMPEETAQLLDKDGWFHTGDLGVRDQDGCYRITGRKRNMIIRGGENIYPLEVERHLSTYPGVRDVRVVGVPSRRLGEEVFAYVESTNGSLCTTQSIRDHFRPRIPRHYIPRYVKVVNSLNGEEHERVDRNELRQMAMDELNLTFEDHPLEIIYES